MPDLTLRSIEITNWSTITNAHIEFPSHGLVFVTGHDTKSTNFDSVGTGKTSLGDAICFALHGIGSTDAIKEFSLDEAGDTLVKLHCGLISDQLDVEVGYKHKSLSKTGSGMRYTFNGEKISCPHVDNTRTELNKIIGVSQRLARWAVLIDGDELQFNKLPQQDMVDLVMDALAQPPWKEFQEKSKKVLDTFVDELTEEKATHASVTTSLKIASDNLASARKELNKAETEYEAERQSHDQVIQSTQNELDEKLKQIKSKKNDKTDIEKKLKELESKKAGKFHEAEISIQELSDKSAVIATELEAIETKCTVSQTTIEAAKQEIGDIQKTPKTCTRCGQTWPKKIDTNLLEEKRKNVSKLEENLNLLQETKVDPQERLDTVNNEINQLESQKSQLTDEIIALGKKQRKTQGELESLLDDKASIDSRLLQLKSGTHNEEVNRLKNIITERQDQVGQLKTRLDESAAAMAESEASVRVCKYWTMAFGPKGIPNMIIEDAVEPLNLAARRISSILTGGSIKVLFETTKELESGEARNELTIKVENSRGSKRLRRNSKGERGITNLIIAETLSEVGQVSERIGFRWYDEVINSLDMSIRGLVLSYLKAVANDKKILIFIVDHHQEVKNYCDYTLRAIKGDQTTFEWS